MITEMKPRPCVVIACPNAGTDVVHQYVVLDKATGDKHVENIWACAKHAAAATIGLA